MNNIIIIRGDTIAISKNPGDFGGFANNSFLSVDQEELLTPLGMFFPSTDQGLDILPVLKHGRKKTLVCDGIANRPHTGIKGVLAAPENGSIEFYSVRVAGDMSSESKFRLIFTQLPTGKNGFAAVSSYDHLSMQAIACLRLTKNVEDTVAMYCRHLTGNPENVAYHTRGSIYKLVRAYYKKKGFLDDDFQSVQEAADFPSVAER